MLRCPTCKKEFQPDDGPNVPFCSERCRMIDLGRWLDERYAVPVEPGEEQFEDSFAEENGSE